MLRSGQVEVALIIFGTPTTLIPTGKLCQYSSKDIDMLLTKFLQLEPTQVRTHASGADGLRARQQILTVQHPQWPSILPCADVCVYVRVYARAAGLLKPRL